MIEITHLTKKYGDHVAVDDLTFRVKKGQIYGFLGPNGAGKSTTMNMITGYIGATDGDIRINGYDIFQEPEFAKKCIGYLPEQPPLYMDMTPFEYLKFVAELKKIDKHSRVEMMEEIMERTKIYEVKDRLIKNLSKGYRQRVGIAQALLGYPELIILDEPTVGLDPKQIIEIRDLIKEIGKKHTVILSSHILSEVSAVCDYVLIINRGKLVASDTPENLTKHLKGTTTISLTVLGTKDVIEKVIKGQKQIESYEIKGSIIEADAFDVELQSKESVDLRGPLFTAFANVQCPILKMQTATMSLEDAFLELTDMEHAEKAPMETTKKSDGEEAKEEN